ncbi:MAG: hypothetical protein KJ607_07345, partial [Bacteroidetes bacterium]|nr:hypothetical protein [Bacteroidota bacterium]
MEDFLDTEIQSIELLSERHKITDSATAVEFDFRCKIDDRFVIIDMQQWYKPDVVHRFYTYHCINTALQLEKMPLKSVYMEDESHKERRIKDYSELFPVITLIWMVDDTLNFKDDYVSYTMTPEIVIELINNQLLWKSRDFTELVYQREIALSQLNNRTKKLDFLQKNRLIFAFQKNIVKNRKYSKYYDWFDLAEKTLNKANQKAEFLKYAEDEIFEELMRRINKETLTEEDFIYIDDYDQFIERVKRYDKGIYEDGREEERKIQEEKQLKKSFEIVRNALNEGLSVELIAKITGLSVDDIEKIKQITS